MAGLVAIATFLREQWATRSPQPEHEESGKALGSPSTQPDASKANRQPQPQESDAPALPPTPRDVPKAGVTTGERQEPMPLPSPVTLQELSAYIYEEFHTSAQRDDFVNRRLNRSVVWEGWVGNVSSNADGTFTVIVKPSMERMLGLGWFIFASAYKPEMLNLSSGQKIKVRGKFTNFDGRFFTLDRCELLEVLPTSK